MAARLGGSSKVTYVHARMYTTMKPAGRTPPDGGNTNHKSGRRHWPAPARAPFPPARAWRVAAPPAPHALSRPSHVDHEDAVIVEVGAAQGRTGEPWARSTLRTLRSSPSSVGGSSSRRAPAAHAARRHLRAAREPDRTRNVGRCRARDRRGRAEAPRPGGPQDTVRRSETDGRCTGDRRPGLVRPGVRPRRSVCAGSSPTSPKTACRAHRLLRPR